MCAHRSDGQGTCPFHVKSGADGSQAGTPERMCMTGALPLLLFQKGGSGAFS